MRQNYFLANPLVLSIVEVRVRVRLNSLSELIHCYFIFVAPYGNGSPYRGHYMDYIVYAYMSISCIEWC